MQSLKSLKLEYNSINLLHKNTFLGLSQLQVLNLSYNGIYTLRAHVFDGLANIYHIELQGKILWKIDADVFNSLPPIHTIKADHFRICCLTTQIRNCITSKQLISSCSSLLKYRVFQIWVWTISVICIAMNLSVLLLQPKRIKPSIEFEPQKFMIRQLACSDILYGIYLLVIAVTDLLLGGNYIIHDLEWRSSITCHISTILASISIVVSAITLVFITALRHGIITNPHKETFWHSSFKVSILMVLTWIIAICTMSMVIRVQWWASKGVFLQHNGLCLIFISDKAMPVNVSINITLNSVLHVALILIMAFYCKLYTYSKKTSRDASNIGKKTEARNQNITHLVFNLWLIIATNIICWIPVVLTSIVLLAVNQVGMNATVIMAIFILPINSALNPVIFTFNTSRMKSIPRRMCFYHNHKKSPMVHDLVKRWNHYISRYLDLKDMGDGILILIR